MRALRAARRRVVGGLLIGCGLGACGDGEPTPPPALQPERLEARAGDAQRVPMGVPLADSLVVRVLTASGEPVPEVRVSWQVTMGDAELLSPALTTTDAQGLAMALVRPRLGVGAEARAEFEFEAEVGIAVEARVDGLESVAFTLTGTTPGAPARYLGRNGYVEYRPGTLPLVISAPHGGTIEPAEIPRRSGGTQVRDLGTDALAFALADPLGARLGARPHLVVFHLHRRMVDANRDSVEATEGHPLGRHAWLEFQGLIDHARQQVAASHGRGFYIDLHGHGHEVQRLELGFLLNAETLRLADEALDERAADSSLRSLVERASVPLSQLLRGPSAPGTRYEELGVPATPSQQDRAPLPGQPFFSGGYNTQSWGSRDGGVIDGMQIEAHYRGIRDTQPNREAFAEVTAEVLEAVLADWYDWVATAGVLQHR